MVARTVGEFYAAFDAVADVAGALADALVDAGAEGSISAKLRRATTDLGALLEQLQKTGADATQIDVVGGKATNAVAVTPSDSADLATSPTSGLYVGVSGSVKVTLSGMTTGDSVVFLALAAGVVHPLAVDRVWEASTATGILAVY